MVRGVVTFHMEQVKIFPFWYFVPQTKRQKPKLLEQIMLA
jgi:hypothetical protein